MKFKTDRILEEYGAISAKLRAIIYALDSFCIHNWNYEITLTELMRTQEEQDSYYSKDEKYKKSPWKSVHQYGRGADVRTNDISQEQLTSMLAFLSMWQYDPKRPEKKSAIYHDIGLGNHIHIQVM